MIHKLRAKFVCAMIVIAAALLAGVLGVVVWFSARNMEMQSLNMMHKIATDTKQYEKQNENTEEIRLPFFVIEVKKHGEMKIINQGNIDLSDESAAWRIYETAMEREEDSGMLREYNLRYLKAKRNKIVCSDTTVEMSNLRSLVLNCLIIYIAALLIFSLISILLSRWMVKPVEKAWEQQRRFVADASHELKTPLSVIMANAELLQNVDIDQPRKDTFAENILTMSYQMRNLVDILLEMARADSGMTQQTFCRLDFSQLVTDASLAIQLLYEEKGLGLKREIQDGVFVNGSEQHLFQLMDVLLDNAQKYTDGKGTVEILLKASGRNCILSVSNPGLPISEEDLKLIFKRFYRADPARTGNGSYGLGLSIADTIVQQHKGKIWAKSSDGKNVFYVLLPRCCGK